MWLAKVILALVCFSKVENQELDSHAIYLEDDLVSSNLIPVLRNDEEEADTDANDRESVVNKYGMRVAAKAVAAIAKTKMEPEEERESRNAQNLNSSSLEMYGDDPLYLKYGVHSEGLYQPLLVGEEKALHYGVLVSTPHGRHLLLVSLLEQLSGTSWSDRCGGKLKIYLPKSLRSPDQPEAPYGACLLANIVEEGVVVNREMVMQKFDKIVKQDEDFEIFSWFDAHHRDVVHKLAEWVLSAESFGSSYSQLVTIRDRLSKQIFVELVNLVIAGREDTGFVTPSMETYMPEAFFDQDALAPAYGSGGDAEDGSDVEQFGYLPVVSQVWENTGRDGRNWVVRGNRWVWEEPVEPVWPSQQQQSSQPWGASGMTWTRDNWQEAEWYFREDPVANAHHSEWHRGGTGPRRGEYFYFMHGQMLARYEGERLSLGLGLTTPFGPGQWDRRVGDSYDPRLGAAWSRRNPGSINA